MKRKIFILLMAILCLVGMTKAQSITLETEGDGVFGKGCLIPVDVYVDTDDMGIYNTEVVVNSQLDFVDFKYETGVFQFFRAPTKPVDDIVYIFGMVPLGDAPFNGKGKLGTLYYKSEDVNPDGFLVELVVDGNLRSSLNTAGRNYLKGTSWISVSVSDDLDPCNLGDDFSVEGGFGDVSYDESLQNFVDEYTNDWQQKKYSYDKNLLVRKILYIGFACIVVCLVVLLCCKKFKGKRS